MGVRNYRDKKGLPQFKFWMFILLKIFMTPWARFFKYGAYSKNIKNIRKELKPPYLVLPNHTGVFDPFLVNMFLPHRVHWLMSASQLRTKFRQTLYSLVGVIAKSKAVVDMDANIKIIKLIKAGHCVGIFPEGKRSWHGETQTIYSGTGKLVKYLNVPVVVPVIRGLYLTEPRWADTFRKNMVEIEYKMLFKKGELENLSAEAVTDKIQKAIENSDTEFATKKCLKYFSKRGAEFLERLFFWCPKCGAVEAIASKNNSVFCAKCDFRSEWQHDGTFDYKDLTVPKWFKMQNDFVEKYIQNAGDDEPLFREKNGYVRKENDKDKLEKLFEGEVIITKTEIIFGDIKIPLSEARGFQSTNSSKKFGNNFEFEYEHKVYSFSSIKNNKINVYKFMVVGQKVFPRNCELDS